MCLIKCRPLSTSLAGRANGSAYSTPCVSVCPSVSLSVCGVGAMWLNAYKDCAVSRVRVIT